MNNEQPTLMQDLGWYFAANTLITVILLLLIGEVAAPALGFPTLSDEPRFYAATGATAFLVGFVLQIGVLVWTHRELRKQP